MEIYIKISLIAIIYALIRAKHDNYISDGKWETWAVVEAIFWTGVIIFGYGHNYIDYIFLPFVFGIVFSIFFDIACGWFQARKLFYFGSGKYDQLMEKKFWTPFYFFLWKVAVLIPIIYFYLVKTFNNQVLYNY